MTTTDHTAVIPAEECYWSIIHHPMRPGRGLCTGDPGAAELTDLLQEEIPAETDEVHAAFIPLDSSRVLACAVPVEVARRASERCTAAHPDRVPECIAADVSAESINLLAGRFEPMIHRKQRDRRRHVLAAAAIAGCVLACVGQLRRASHAEEDAARAELLANAGLAERWPNLTPGDARRELDEALASAVLSRSPGEADDAALDLACVLSSLPSSFDAEVLSLRADAGTVDLSLASVSDASQFVASLRRPEGWSLREPRLDSSAAGARVQLTFDRARSDAP